MKLKYLFAVLFTFAACSQDEPAAPDPVQLAEDEVMLSLPEFQMEEGGHSRTIVDIQPNKVKYSWKAGDLVGIFPDAGGDQVYFSIQPDAQNTSNATAVFDGGGWALKRGFNYIAYYPFQPEFKLDKDNMQVSFKGQQQEGRTTDHLSGYDYMVAAGAAPQQGNLHFQFHHLGTLGIANVTLPEPGKVNRLTFQFPNAEDRYFHETASFSISEGEKAALKPLTTSNSFVLQAKDLNVTDADEEIVMAFMQGPMANVAGKACNAILNYTATDGTTKNNTVTFDFAHDWATGKAYILNLFFTPIEITANQHTIICHKPGYLTAEHVLKALGSGKQLVIKGYINGNDFKLIREYIGAEDNQYVNVKPSPNRMDKIHELDLSDVTIVAGGDSYTTEANALPNLAFNKSRLTSLKLPSNLTKICKFSISNIGITEIAIPESVTTIDSYSFIHTKLTSLTIPGAVANLGSNFIDYSNDITSLTFNTDKPTIASATLADFKNSKNCDLVIPISWYDKVSISPEGEFMFLGLAWKSIKTDTGIGLGGITDEDVL